MAARGPRSTTGSAARRTRGGQPVLFVLGRAFGMGSPPAIRRLPLLLRDVRHVSAGPDPEADTFEADSLSIDTYE
jgi:hypothetical protein